MIFSKKLVFTIFNEEVRLNAGKDVLLKPGVFRSLTRAESEFETANSNGDMCEPVGRPKVTYKHNFENLPKWGN